jgi:quercetin dioxygenase-like cupin family protein
MESDLFVPGTTFRFDSKVEYSEGGIVSKRVIQKEQGNVTLFAFDSGQKLSEHTAPFDALVQILDGEAEIVIGGNPNILTAPMSIIMPAGIPHAVNAISPFKMLLTMIRS